MENLLLLKGLKSYKFQEYLIWQHLPVLLIFEELFTCFEDIILMSFWNLVLKSWKQLYLCFLKYGPRKPRVVPAV